MPKLGNRVVIWATALTAVGTIVLAAVAVIGLQQVDRSDQSPGPSASGSMAPSHPSHTPPGSECVDQAGNPTYCGNSGSGLVVNPSPCTTKDALAILAVDPMRQVDVKAASPRGQCALFPSSRASEAGASGLDIKQLATTTAVPKLAVCYATHAGSEVACSQPHRLEAISNWESSNDDSQQRQERCTNTARAYTERTFNSPAERLTPVVLGQQDDQSMYRCAIQAKENINMSFWKIGGRELSS